MRIQEGQSIVDVLWSLGGLSAVEQVEAVMDQHLIRDLLPGEELLGLAWPKEPLERANTGLYAHEATVDFDYESMDSFDFK